MADLRNILTDCYQRNGKLTPKVVVEEARPSDAPLHDRFEWDDAVAGERWRESQASELIRSVKIEFIEKRTGERRFVRAFHSLHEAGASDREGYAPTEEVVQDDLTMKILERQCEREVAEVKRKYGHLSAFAEIMRAAVA